MIDLLDAIKDGGLPGPEYIRLTQHRDKLDSVYALPHRLTLADWRQAQSVVVRPDDKHALRQFRMATLVLMLAERKGLPEDAVVLPTLGWDWRGLNAFDPDANPHMVQGADGIWRNKTPTLQ